MNIISWNVNGLRANINKGGFDWLLNQSPDIFCLQETKAHVDQLDDGIKNVEGYYSYFDHSKVKKGYSGVAVYSKIKPNKVEYGLGNEKYDQEGRFLGLFFDNFAIFNVYFPNGGGGPERLQFKLEYYKHFLEYIEKLRKTQKNIIFCGDVNTAHNEIDIARPKENQNHSGFMKIERDWIDLIIKTGYIDTFRELNGNKVQYSWWDMKTFARDRNIGWRLDYFFVSREMFSSVKKSQILDSVFGSDHCPILLEI